MNLPDNHATLEKTPEKRLPLLDAVPKTIPRYANTLWYGLGGFTLLAFFLLVASGVWMVAAGMDWVHTSAWGHYVHAVHFWSAQAFMLFLLLHFLRVFFTGAYRKPREFTWMTGVLLMIMAIITGLMGYITRADWSAQWHAFEAKDLLNAAHIGGLVNVLNYQLVFGLHTAAIPLVMIALMVVHFILVRLHGVARPY